MRRLSDRGREEISHCRGMRVKRLEQFSPVLVLAGPARASYFVRKPRVAPMMAAITTA